jgi:hypothetical protein
MSEDIRRQVSLGKLSWKEAAIQAQETRNLTLEIMRDRSTSVGRAFAEKMKTVAPNFETMVGRKTAGFLDYTTQFDKLPLSDQNLVLSRFKSMSAAEKNLVFEEIVVSAGRGRDGVAKAMSTLRPAGRVVIFISIAISVYTVANAEDKLDAIGKESASFLSGIGGGMLGGAAAGLVCGPGAPVCVTIGAFVGGAAAAFAVDFAW